MTSTDLRNAFYSSIRRGTGEAWLIREAHPDLHLTDLVIAACLKHLAYDPQFEGSRAGYLFRLYKADQNHQQIRDAILNRIADPRPIDTWDLDQLMDLAVLLHRDGTPDARDVLLQRYQAAASRDAEHWGDDQIIEMDGWEGLVTVAETRGHRILSKGGWDDGTQLRYYQKAHPETDAEAALEKLAKNSKEIRAWLASVHEQRRIRPPETAPFRESYESVRERIESETYYRTVGIRATELHEDEFKRLAEDAVLERRPGRLMGFYRLFAKRRFPFDFRLILERIRDIPETEGRYLGNGIAALAQFEDGLLREFAIEKIKSATWPAVYMPLLRLNYRPGDADFILDLLTAEHSDSGLHALAGETIEIYTQNRFPEAEKLLIRLYDTLNCGLCRTKIVELLRDLDTLPAPIVAELPFDSCQDVRKFSNLSIPRLGEQQDIH